MKKNKAIWLFSGGAMQELAARKIVDLGYKLILTDINPDCVCAKYADEFLACDTFDLEGNKAAAEKLRNKYIISAGITLAADCHETVAHINRQLELPGISPEIARICRHKNLTRAVLTNAGIPQPQYACVQNIEEAKSFLDMLGGQGVIKATDSSGSRGFSVITPGQLLTREQFEYTQRMGTTGGVVLEERLEADVSQISEASVETLWSQGTMYWINWVDRIFPRDLRFFSELTVRRNLNEGIEIGHINPAKHDYHVKNQVRDYIEKAGRALGMHHERGAHILKADVFFSARGPVLLEITPRTSGGWDSSASSPARGADIVGGVIRFALGETLDLDMWYRHFHYHDSERTAVVMSKILDDAVNCLGRQFALASGYGPVGPLINEANQKLDKGEHIVPV